MPSSFDRARQMPVTRVCDQREIEIFVPREGVDRVADFLSMVADRARRRDGDENGVGHKDLTWTSLN